MAQDIALKAEFILAYKAIMNNNPGLEHVMKVPMTITNILLALEPAHEKTKINILNILGAFCIFGGHSCV